MILTYEGKTPKIAANVFIAPTAVVIGAVDIQEGASIWYGAVLRGDIAAITVGRNTNIQDNCTVHTEHGHPTVIGAGVTIGHNAVIHGCVIEDDCLISIAATLTLISGCTHSVRTTQIPVRDGLNQCAVLEPTPREARAPVAEDPDLGALLAAAGVTGEDHIAMIERAAGNYARTAQFVERGRGDQRDIAQAVVNRGNCERLQEAVDLINTNNAGPQN